MSYFRGPVYIWNDGNHVHLWNVDGYDFWDESAWADGYGIENSETTGQESAPSGVQITQDQMDQYVVMHFAELVEAGRVSEVIAQATEQAGNGGARALLAKASAISMAFPPIAASAT